MAFVVEFIKLYLTVITAVKIVIDPSTKFFVILSILILLVLTPTLYTMRKNILNKIVNRQIGKLSSKAGQPFFAAMLVFDLFKSKDEEAKQRSIGIILSLVDRSVQ